jgi:alkylation response protein AidB-like acyl-CoA dehydrogenase
VDFSIIELDPEVEAFWNSEVIPFMDAHLSEEILGAERAESGGLLPEYQRALAERGWLPSSGVVDDAPTLDPVRAAVVGAEEIRRAGAMFPVIGSRELILSVVRQFGSDELRAELGPGVRSGDIHCCLGYTEPDCGSDAAAIRTRAVRDGDEWVINGQKMFSTGAHLCQYVMATARTNTTAGKHQSITMFLVPLRHPGVEVQGIATLGGERTNFVYFDDVRISDSHRLGPVDQGWQVASGALAAEHGMGDREDEELDERAADLVAALGKTRGWRDEFDTLLRAAERWAATPRADGSSPADDPATRLRLARLALKHAVADVTPSPYVRVIASDLMLEAAADLIALAGPTGLLGGDADGAPADGVIEWAHRFAQGTSIYGGTTDIQRNLIAEHILGLPRHRGLLRG